MDNLVLIRVAASLGEKLHQAPLLQFRHEPSDHFRMTFDCGERLRTVKISLRPEQPWIGLASDRASRKRPPPTAFAAAACAALEGHRLESIDKPLPERLATLRFGAAGSLVVELAPRAANLVLLDAAGSVVGTARRASAGRL
ncbi:MAG TPA: hypothetical protein VJS92_15005, partial [Candidatus Polarisedimenticolaceae bacterium]|nr:hypothetical protein [Candidatus Polarisedimenticolaceae bacterium]